MLWGIYTGPPHLRTRGIKQVPNAKDLDLSDVPTRILMVGPTGSGKTAQIHTLPGRKFAYIFDPNSLQTLRGLDLDYEEFMPEMVEMDATLKGFNKGARDDTPATKREPTLYNRWVEHLNDFEESGEITEYDWMIFDSLTFLVKACMDRQLFINNRYGKIEDLSDYRVVGNKISTVFRTVTSIPINLVATGHLQVFQDDKTKKVETLLQLPGSSRNQLPLMFTDLWLAQAASEGDELKFEIQTIPEKRGLQTIRSSLNVKAKEDVTIKNFARAGEYGIGAILKRQS